MTKEELKKIDEAILKKVEENGGIFFIDQYNNSLELDKLLYNETNEDLNNESKDDLNEC